MILSDCDIRKLNQSGGALVDPFEEDRLQAASYDLSMSSHISVFKKQVHTINLADQENVDSMYSQIELSDDGYTVQPGEFILITVSEKITVPTNMVAHIRPRTRFTRLGVLLSAQHCNPGYSGVLSLGLYNASPNAVILVPGVRVAQVVFEELSSTPSAEKQYQNKRDAAYMAEDNFRGANFEGTELSDAARGLYDALLKRMHED